MKIQSIQNYSLIFAFLLIFLAPQTTIFNVVILAMFSANLILNFKGNINYPMLIFPFTGFCFIVLINLDNLSNVPSNEVFRLVSIMLLFGLSSSLIKCEPKYIKLVLIVFMSYSFTIALSYMFEITLVTSLVDSYYQNLEIWKTQAGVFNFSNFRTGSYFFNPNLYGQYIVFSYLLFLKFHVGTKGKEYWLFTIFHFLLVLSTGSRTAFAIYALVITFTNIHLIRRYKVKFSLILLVFISVTPFLATIDLDYRFLKFDEGMVSSLSTKSGMLSKYANEEVSFKSLFFGNIYNGEVPFDNDIGYIFYSFGFLGVLVFLSYIFVVSRGNLLFGLVFLFCISTSVFFNFRFLIGVVILFSLYPTREKSV